PSLHDALPISESVSNTTRSRWMISPALAIAAGTSNRNRYCSTARWDQRTAVEKLHHSNRSRCLLYQGEPGPVVISPGNLPHMALVINQPADSTASATISISGSSVESDFQLMKPSMEVLPPSAGCIQL